MSENTETAPRQTRTGGATVTVACKVPPGLRLRVFSMEKDHEPVMGGGTREVKIARLAGEAVINGPATRKENAPACVVVGGYALTSGVNKDLFDKWMEDNKDSPMVKNRLIFAHDRQDSAAGAAKEAHAVRSNMEPLNGADDVRVPRGGVARIQAGERAA